MDKYLKETKMLDYSNENIQQLIRERRWKNINEFERLKSIYDFVRDEILFGYNIDDNVPASKVLADGYGQCNTKGILFMALLRGDLPFAETLVGMERHHAVCFTKSLLYSPHILPRMICPAMDAGDELGALVQLGLGIILRIVQCLGKGIVFGLVRVGCIVKDAL